MPLTKALKGLLGLAEQCWKVSLVRLGFVFVFSITM